MYRSLASAVAVPEPQPEPLLTSPEGGLKRRKSSVSETDSKRRRLSTQDEHGALSPRDNNARPSSPAASTERRPSRRGDGAAEERKRGQRLFSALLGTLSQGSSSAAQKRRADIEKRQQAKLKMQDEEHGELKRKKREELVTIRKRQQRVLEREAVCLTVANARICRSELTGNLADENSTLEYVGYGAIPEDKDGACAGMFHLVDYRGSRLIDGSTTNRGNYEAKKKT
jgi:hypothetical protein